MDSFDLLGMDPVPPQAAPQVAPQPAPVVQAQGTLGAPMPVLVAAPAVAQPLAVQANTVAAAPAVAVAYAVPAQAPDGFPVSAVAAPATAVPAPAVQAGAGEIVSRPGARRYRVRCEGRWRVRSAPSLSSKVIGTVASGTIVLAEESLGDVADGPDGESISALWVRVSRLEAQEPFGVSEIKRDAASGGVMFCLRRNALGYGLYEIGVEPMDGELITLSDDLTSELRTDAQRASADKGEDVSLTWKLLSAADSFNSFFSKMGPTPAASGTQEDLKAAMRRRPDDVFECKQRDQLKQAAASLKKACVKLLEASPDDPASSLATLAKEIRGRFARIRCSLFEAARAAPTVSNVNAARAYTAGSDGEEGPPPMRGGEDTPHVDPSNHQEETAYGTGELPDFCEALARIEKTGGWQELSPELRQELVAFANKHSKDLEHHAIEAGRARRMFPAQSAAPAAAPAAVAAAAPDMLSMGAPTAASASLIDFGDPVPAAVAARPAAQDMMDIFSDPVPAPAAAAPAAKVAAKATGAVPMLLPPPPPPSNAVKGSNLLF